MNVLGLIKSISESYEYQNLDAQVMPQFVAFVATDLQTSPESTKLKLLYSFLKNYLHKVAWSVNTAKDEIQKAMFSSIGPPSFRKGKLSFQVKYANGDYNIINVWPDSQGLIFDTNKLGYRPVLIGYDNPGMGIKHLLDEIFIGGKTLRNNLARFSGRGVALGQRGINKLGRQY